MATQIKRPNALQKTVTPKSIAPVTEKSVTEPVVEAVPVDKKPEVVAPVVKQPKPRVQTNQIIETNLSAARVRRWIDKLTINNTIDLKILALKEQLSPYEIAKERLETGQKTVTVNREVNGKKQAVSELKDISQVDRANAEKTIKELGPSVPDLEARISALSHERTRFSNESPIALSIVCEEIVKDLVVHAMKQAILSGKKIIQVEHVHMNGVRQLKYAALFVGLPTFDNADANIQRTSLEESAKLREEKLVKEAVSAFKRQHNVRVSRKKPVAATTTDNVEKPAEDAKAEVKPEAKPEAKVEEAPELPGDDDPESKTSFKHYVQLICKKITKENPQYSTIRISTEIRDYLSDLVIEFVGRVANAVQLIIQSMKNKTVSEFAILRVIELLMIDGHAAQEDIKLEPAQIHDPEMLKAEVAKREAAKKEGKVYKVELAKIPKINGYIATKIITYPKSGYTELAALVHSKLKIYDDKMVQLSTDAKKLAAENDK